MFVQEIRPVTYIWKDELHGNIFYRIYRPFFGEFILESVVTFGEAKQRIDDANEAFEKIIVGKPKFLITN